jgi:hypothetical protein
MTKITMDIMSPKIQYNEGGVRKKKEEKIKTVIRMKEVSPII